MKTFFSVGDTVPQQCELCRTGLILYEIDSAERIAVLACPVYLDGDDRHDFQNAPLGLRVCWENNGQEACFYVGEGAAEEVFDAANRIGLKIVRIEEGYVSPADPDYYADVEAWQSTLPDGL